MSILYILPPTQVNSSIKNMSKNIIFSLLYIEPRRCKQASMGLWELFGAHWVPLNHHTDDCAIWIPLVIVKMHRNERFGGAGPI